MKRMITALLCLTLLLVLLVVPANAAADVTFVVSADYEGCLSPGQEVTFTVTVVGTARVTQIGFSQPQFDANVFEFVDIVNSTTDALIYSADRVDGLASLWQKVKTLPGKLELGKITLRVKNDAPLGTTEVTALQVAAKNASANVAAELQSAKLTIADHESDQQWASVNDINHAQHCKLCGAQMATAAHHWDEGVVITAPTCTEAGSKEVKCVDCGATKIEAIPATNHAGSNEAVFAGQKGYYCAACDNYFFKDGSYVMATVRFCNWDGTVLSSKNYRYKDKVELPADPTKAADNTYTYAFAGWDKVVVDCAGNATYTATYDATYIDYTVTFLDADGTVISTDTYHWGDKVKVPADPTKAADNTYTYAFAGWNKAVVDCAGNATYTATYKATYIDYVVTFLDEDGAVISTDTYHWGDEVKAPAEPTKAADNTYTYAFAGWDKTVVNCAGDAVYTAAYSRTCLYDYTVVDNAITITQYLGNGGNVVIPDTIEGIPVTGIGDVAFSDCEGLTGIILPDAITTIGIGAFDTCPNLQYTAYDNGKYLGSSKNPYLYLAAAKGTGITNCKVHGDTKILGASAFSACVRLTGITIPEGVTYIPYALFSNCISMKEIVIPNGVTRIDDNAFYGCVSLTNITIPDTVREIGDYAFYNCSGIANVSIPDSVIYMGDRVFASCYALTSVTIGDGVTGIGASAFYGCSMLQNVTIGNSVTAIGEWAFAWCSSLVSVAFPDSVTIIDAYAFTHCERLDSVTMGNKVSSIGEEAFSYCFSLSELVLTDSVTTIDCYAFAGCTGLTGIVIPDSVICVEESAFSGCYNLQEVFYLGTEALCQEMLIGLNNNPMVLANWHYEVTDAVINEQACYYCLECDKYFLADGTEILPRAKGDFNGDDEVNNEDVVYLLWHTVFPESYPVEASADFTGDGAVNNEDVVYLLWHILFPESYPLTDKKKRI